MLAQVKRKLFQRNVRSSHGYAWFPGLKRRTWFPQYLRAIQSLLYKLYLPFSRLLLLFWSASSLIHLAHNPGGPQLRLCFRTSALLHSQLLSSNSSPENLIGLPSPWDVTFGMRFSRPMDRADSLKRARRSTGHEA